MRGVSSEVASYVSVKPLVEKKSYQVAKEDKVAKISPSAIVL